MSFDLKVDPVLSGGTTVVLTPAGLTAGKAVYAFPNHTRIKPQTVEMTISTRGTKAAPIAATGVKLSLGDRETSEGCCTVNEGVFVVDTGVRYEIGSVTEASIDLGISYYRAFVQSDEFVTAIKAGLLPA